MFTLPNSWQSHLNGELQKDYMKDIESFLASERLAGKIIYPLEENIFKALELTNFDNVKVVIIGQDPYHGEGQAHGLSFSVEEGVKVPPSLRNIYKELDNEGLPSPLRSTLAIAGVDPGAGGEVSGNLESWAEQGVLLLNSVLSVEAGQPASHSKIGWQEFTDCIIKTLSKEKSGLVFLLWGAYAISKSNLVDSEKHLILTSPHPSPFSAYKGFLGNKHFSKTNEYLQENGKKMISW